MKNRTKSLDCEKVRDMMFEYIDGELSPSEVYLFEAHISACEECKKELGIRRNLISLIGEAGDIAEPDLLKKIMSATEGVPQEKKNPFASFRLMGAGTLVAACAVFAVLVVGRGYIFGGTALDDVDLIENAADHELEYYLADDAEAVNEPFAASYGLAPAMGAVVAAPAENADSPAEAVVEIEPDDTVYSVTAATVKAAGPVMMRSPSPKATSDTVTEEGGELDLFVNSAVTDGTAVIACFDGDLLPDLGEPVEKAISVGGQICDLYLFPSEPILAYDRVVGGLRNAGVEYRCLIPDGEEIRSLAVYVLHRENG